jgi:hypothetical protein
VQRPLRQHHLECDMTVLTLPLRRPADAGPRFAGLRAAYTAYRERRDFAIAYEQADYRVRAEMVVAARHQD